MTDYPDAETFLLYPLYVSEGECYVNADRVCGVVGQQHRCVRPTSPADLLAVLRRGVESGTIKGEVVEDECPWCAGDGCWEESNPLPGYSPGPAPMTCPYCKGVGRVLVIPVSTEGET